MLIPDLLRSINEVLDDYEPTSSFITAFSSLATCWIAWMAYTTFIRNKLLEEQFTKVLELVNLLKRMDLETHYSKQFQNNVNVYVEEHSFFESPSPTRKFPFFDQLRTRAMCESRSNCTYLVITEESRKRLYELKELAMHPIMPKEISKVLRDFILSEDTFIVGQQGDKHKTLPNICLAVKGYSLQLKSDVSGFWDRDRDGDAFRSWERFQDSSIKLSRALRNWFKDHGNSDVNF